MSELNRLLQQVNDGEVEVEEVAPLIAWLVSTVPGVAAE